MDKPYTFHIRSFTTLTIIILLMMVFKGISFAKNISNISFNAKFAKTYRDADFGAGATNAVRTITYSRGNWAVTPIVGRGINIVEAKPTNIAVKNSKGTSLSHTVAISKAPQAITFPPLGTSTLDYSSVALSATSNSGLAVVYTLDNPAFLVIGNTLWFSASGTVNVTASQPGNTNYDAAVPVTQRFTVLPSWTAKKIFGGSGRYEGSGFNIGNKGYVGVGRNKGGLNKDFWQYDPDTDVWTQKADFGGSARCMAVGFSAAGKGYIGLGESSLPTVWNDMWQYDPVANTWVQKSNLPGPGRYGAFSMVVNGNAYAGGGSDDQVYLHDMWEYMPATDTWVKKADNPAGFPLYNQTFSIGLNGYLVENRGYYKYDALADTWVKKNAMTGKLITGANYDISANSSEILATLAIGNKGYMFVNSADGGGGFNSAMAWEYNPVAETFTQRPSNPILRNRHLSSFAVNNKAYLVTGIDQETNYGSNDLIKQDNWEFDPNPGVLPVINAQGTLVALSTIKGTASASSSFSMSGTNLTAGVLVTPPQGFEVSTDNNTFGRTVTVGTLGNLASKTVYIRLAATTTVGTYAGNVVLSSAGATNVSIPTVSSTVTAPALIAITVTPVAGIISACAGTVSVNPSIQHFSVSGSNLSTNVIATASAGFEISLATGSGYGNTLTLTQSGGTLNRITVYVRSASSASPGNISGNVVLTSVGATSRSVAVAGTINEFPSVDAISNQTVAGGKATNAISFTGAANTFNWTNDKPGIGLPASGTGNIASFVAVNAGNNQVTATITVTPTSSGGNNCSGTPIKFTITVTPATAGSPVVAASGTLSALSTTYGTASPSTSFKVSGTNLNTGISVIPPTGFEVSSDNITFSNNVTIGTPGNIASATVYIRLAAEKAAGNYLGNVVVSSNGAANVNIATANSTIAKALLKITADNQTRPYGQVNPVFRVNYNGFVNGDSQLSLTTLPTVTTTAITTSNVGRYPILPTGAASANYVFGYVNGVLNITPIILTITFNSLSPVTYGDPDFSAGAIASDGESIIYSSDNPAVATIVNGMIHIIGAGQVNITATIATNTNTTALSVSENLIVNKANQIINLEAIPNLSPGDQYDVSGITASSGLPVTFVVSDITAAKITGIILTAIKTGTVALTVSQAGDSNYNAASAAEAITISDAGGNEIFVHKEVSPNSDGVNDFLRIDGIENFASNTVTIYNRNGVKVFQIDKYDNLTRVFNGQSNVTGVLQQSGTYYYSVGYTVNFSYKRKTGFFVLKYN